MTSARDIRAPNPPARRPVWSAARLAALLLASLVLATGLSLFSLRAYAAFVPVPGVQGSHLHLLSDSAYLSELTPGQVKQWQISATTSEPAATLSVQFAPTGALVTQPIDGLQIQVQRCDAEWTNLLTTPACSEARNNVFGPGAANSMPAGTATDLGGITAVKGKFLLVTLWLPDTPYARADKTLQGLSASIGFGLTAAGDTDTVTSTVGGPPISPAAEARLALTGADALPLGLLALGTIGLGFIVGGARKIRASNAERMTP